MNELLSSWRPGRARLAVAATCMGVVACTSTPELVDKPLKVSTHDLVGSVHVAVLSNQPWDDIRKELKPSFEVTSKDALNLAIPATQNYVDRAVSAIAFGLGLDLGERSTSTLAERVSDRVSKSTTTDNGSGEAAMTAESSASAVETDKRTTVRRPGSAASAPAATLMDPTKYKLTGALEPARALEVDPVMRHKVATAIYQEIQMLNRYVDAAVQRTGYKAEFVRMQVSLMPRSPRLPYDTYVNVAFFASCLGDNKSSQVSEAGCVEADKPQGERNYTALQVPLARSPLVVPLLVTDNIESTLAARDIEALRQIALGLSGVLSSVGVRTDFNSFSDRQQALLGRSFNSIMTMGRVTDNMLRVRLGAVNQGPSGLRMVPRTHDVSLLVLVPKGTKRVTVTSKTEFVDPDTAETLPSRSSTDREKEMRVSVAKKYDDEYCFVDEKDEDGVSGGFKRLQNIAFVGNQDAFRRELADSRKLCSDAKAGKPSWQRYRGGHNASWQPDENTTPDAAKQHDWRHATYVWTDMISLIPGSRFNHTVFDIVAKDNPKPDNACPQPQTAVLRDNGTEATAVLPLGKEIVVNEISAFLHLGEKTSCKGGKYAAQAIRADDVGRTLTLAFPSLKAMDVTPACMVEAEVQLSGCVDATADATSGGKTTAAKATSLPAAKPVMIRAAAGSQAGAAAAAPSPSALAPAHYAVRYVPPKPAEDKPAANSGASSLRLTSTHVTVDDAGVASINVTVRRGGEKSVLLGLRGADIAEISDTRLLETTDAGWTVTGSGTVQLLLKNLHEGRPVRLFLTDADGKPLKAVSAEVAVLGPARKQPLRLVEMR